MVIACNGASSPLNLQEELFIWQQNWQILLQMKEGGGGPDKMKPHIQTKNIYFLWPF